MRVLIQRVDSRRATLSEFRALTLVIGRGTTASIRSTDAAVALDHAAISRDIHGYSITDRGSLTGTYVNGLPVETERLKSGDTIVIGDLVIHVDAASSEKPLVLRLGGGEFVEPKTAATRTSKAARDVDYTAAFSLKKRFINVLIIVGIALVAAVAFIGDISSPRAQLAFMPGGIASAHGRILDANGHAIGTQCEACHDAWKGVAETRCESCHHLPAHSVNAASAGPCSSCHVEHRAEQRVEQRIAAITNTTCVQCHSNIAPHLKPGVVETVSAHVSSFDRSHPDFRMPVDRDTLRFDHHKHLKPIGLFDATGKREKLQCDSCHSFRDGRIEAEPIRFKDHCQRCHDLTFDARFPKDQVPHGGDPRLVYAYVASVMGGAPSMELPAPISQRRIFAQKGGMNVGSRAMMTAEHVIKVRCALCHQIENVGERLAVTPPTFINNWLSKSQFSHPRHRNVDCDRCHTTARQSERTSDVLLPGRSACSQCHSATANAHAPNTVQAPTSCLTCHGYHEPSKTLSMRGIAAN